VLPGGDAVIYATALDAGSQLAVTDPATGRTSNLGTQGVPLGLSGDELIFIRGDGALMAVPFDARARRVTGSARVVVAEVRHNPATLEPKAAVSANGSLAYVSGSEIVQVVAVDERGTARPLPIPADQLSDPRYSPDGRRVLVALQSAGRTDVWMYDVASGAPRRVTAEGTVNMRAEWSPDGTRVLYRSNRSGQNTSLWWQAADGSGVAQQLIAVPGNDIFEGVLVADGRTVVYRTGSVGSADIWYRRLAGDTAAHAIATTPFNEMSPRVSPDGRWVAYMSNESGAYQVYVRPFPGPGELYPVSVGGGTTPVWSRDGRRIFFVNGNQLMAASVATSPTFSVTAREALFSGVYSLPTGHAPFDVAADGKSFLMLRSVAANREEIVVIPNWAAELRAQAAKR
jgi:dipeptidyl aminopeptidase/acylaminoacyl peptidase